MCLNTFPHLAAHLSRTTHTLTWHESTLLLTLLLLLLSRMRVITVACAGCGAGGGAGCPGGYYYDVNNGANNNIPAGAAILASAITASCS